MSIYITQNKSHGTFDFLIIFFSVSGIPPLTGFLAKIFVVFHLLESNEILIAVLLFVLNMISVYYYLRIIKIIYFICFKVNLEAIIN